MPVPSVTTVVVVGLGLVFVILALLVVILVMLGRVFSSADKKKAAGNAAAAVKVPVRSAPVASPNPAPVIESGIPAEVVAVIAAAVAAMDGGKYTLRSLTRKKESGNPWNVAARASYTQPF